MKNFQKKFQIGVVGSAGCKGYKKNKRATNEMMAEAEKIGKKLADNNFIVVTGGKDGIMEAAARGAKLAGGTTVGVIKGSNRFTSNSFTDIEVISGMATDGFDELILVNMCDALIIIGGGAGTLEEITIAYRNNKPMVALTTQDGWGKKLAGNFLDKRNMIKIETAKDAEEAVVKVLKLLSL
ncbi:MAG: TIGR00725 family protein [Patescibacteria group bacterium]